VAIKVQADRVVSIAYRMLDGDGRVLEERTPENPYEYLQGRGQIVGAVERALEGKTAGFRAEIHVDPSDAYGQYDPALVVEIPRTQFPKTVELSVGMKFNTTGPNGQSITVRVIEIRGKTVTVDGNHPLAGIDLRFEVRVLDVREATAEESESGKVASHSSLPPGSGSLH
jgi:FKBP-type peptidyl-prolyl cis-trans isomerase SlyD